MESEHIRRIRVIDSHTGGEPTRVVLSGFPELGRRPIAEQLAALRLEHDRYRSAVINEPRGSDVLVGALLCEPSDATCIEGVIFFNNVGYLGMCGHGTIGLMVTLAHLGRIGPGIHRIETPVGVVSAELEESGDVVVRNVASYRLAKDVTVSVDGFGPVTGDVAWGGNWFFLVQGSAVPIEMKNVESLTDYAWRIRKALERDGVTGADGQEIDHIELFGPPESTRAHSKNFVLCPGKSYDRSPCGTGTSAKLACLCADGKLREGKVWRQESITGSIFEGSYRVEAGLVYPLIRGSAFVDAEAELILDERDPFCWGIGRCKD
jgi:4-hydroxyproline epimerase